MRHIAALLLVMCLTHPACAADWIVDSAKSQLGFSVQWQDHPFRGLFRKWDAQITFDPQDIDHAKAMVQVDIASITTGSDEMDQGLKGAEGFDANAYSTATFETTWFRATGKDAYEARGNLTLHGLTRAITLPFRLEINGNTATMRGTANVVRTDFRVGMGQFAGEYPVAHQVNVLIYLVAKKAK